MILPVQNNPDPCIGPALTIDCLSRRLEGIPEPPRIFRGIVIPSLGAFFGPAKSGKTTLVENLAFSIASGSTHFMGDPIYSSNKRVLLVSLEEYYRNRTLRNKRQMKFYDENQEPYQEWTHNIFVVDENFPRYLVTADHWKMLEDEIERIGPGIVVVDSLTRLSLDPIEDSSTASKLMKRLREIAHKHQIALILIHHSQKMEDRPITIASLAGSRVVGQELDFMIGVNRTNANIRYLKDVAYRYWPDDSEHVTKFSIDVNQVIVNEGQAYESDLISQAMTSVNGSDQLLLNYFLEVSSIDPSTSIKTHQLYEKFVNPGLMSRPTLHTALKRLEAIGAISKLEKGIYKVNVS
jgi:predicted ATP-dependent serine protease